MRRTSLAIVGLFWWALAAAPLALGGPAPAGAERLAGRRLMEMLDEHQRTADQYAEGLVSVEAKGLVQFLEPAEVRGVGLLTIGHGERPDEQWFYTPAIDRHRRIARVEKSTRFLGTHFTYEDMQPRDIDDQEYRRLDDAELDGAVCYRIEARPRPKTESQYSRMVYWVAREPLVIVRSEGWVDGKLRRTFHGSEVRAVDGIVTPHRWVVEDTLRKGRTTLTLRNVRHRLGLGEELFAREAMRVLHAPP